MKLIPNRSTLSEDVYLAVRSVLFGLSSRQILSLLFAGELSISDTYNFCTLKLLDFDQENGNVTIELSGWIEGREVKPTALKCEVV
ncbi:hypothetical protein JCM12825_01190 [Desulfurobacterium crinifex]